MTTPGTSSDGRRAQGRSWESVGRPEGIAPTVGPAYPESAEYSSPATAATSTPGTSGWTLAAPVTIRIVTAESPTAAPSQEPEWRTAQLALPRTLPCGAWLPNASGSWDATMRIAAADRNPVITARDIR
jgi:hypothetical protein